MKGQPAPVKVKSIGELERNSKTIPNHRNKGVIKKGQAANERGPRGKKVREREEKRQEKKNRRRSR